MEWLAKVITSDPAVYTRGQNKNQQQNKVCVIAPVGIVLQKSRQKFQVNVVEKIAAFFLAELNK